MTDISHKPRHILLIDDDEDDAKLFKIMVKSFDPGIMISLATNGVEGLEKLRQSTDLPDLVFLDINMPLMDGFECLEEIKKDSLLNDIPIIMYSTSSIEKQVAKAYHYGAHLYVVKPFEIDAYAGIFNKVFSQNWKQQGSRPTIESFVLGDRFLSR